MEFKYYRHYEAIFGNAEYQQIGDRTYNTHST
jgi:hypothetical protein